MWQFLLVRGIEELFYRLIGAVLSATVRAAANPSNKNYKERVASLIFVLSAARMNLAEVRTSAYN